MGLETFFSLILRASIMSHYVHLETYESLWKKGSWRKNYTVFIAKTMTSLLTVSIDKSTVLMIKKKSRAVFPTDWQSQSIGISEVCSVRPRGTAGSDMQKTWNMGSTSLMAFSYQKHKSVNSALCVQSRLYEA